MVTGDSKQTNFDALLLPKMGRFTTKTTTEINENELYFFISMIV